MSRLVSPVLLGMGYELVDIEFAGAGLLRVTIDIADRSRSVQVEDCEKVSHQLGRVFAVENLDYERLEVSSPGLDRPLKRPSDFERFEGSEVALRLRVPVNGRRSFTGVLRRVPEASDRWEVLYSDQPDPEPVARGKRSPSRGLSGRVGARAGGRNGQGAKGAGGAGAGGTASATDVAAAALLRVEFTLDQVDKARLVPKLAF